MMSPAPRFPPNATTIPATKGTGHIAKGIFSDIMGFGGMKVITDRAATYFNRVLTILNLILLINLNSLAGADLMQYLWICVIGGIAFVALMIFDLLVIYPDEINFRDIRSDVMGGTKKKVEEIDKKLDTLIARLEKP